jgi:hypothetical protein
MEKAIRFALLAVCLLPAGCGSSGSSDIVKARGTVTYHHQPLPDVSVTFLPDHGRPANGKTDAAGRFVLSTLNLGDGAVLGPHKVSIATTVATPMPGTPEAKAAGHSAPSFPAKYSNPNSSGLTAVVEARGPNDFLFELTD